MAFAGGDKASTWKPVGKVGPATPAPAALLARSKYFDSGKFSLSRLKHLLQAKAVLCPGLTISSATRHSGEETSGTTRTASSHYLLESHCPTRDAARRPLHRHMEGPRGGRLGPGLAPEGGEPFAESYVNLVPRCRAAPTSTACAPGCRGDARVLRVPQPAAARGQAGPRGRLERAAPTSCRSSCSTRSSPARPRSACPPAECAPSSPAW
jgi:hypothetical protein